VHVSVLVQLSHAAPEYPHALLSVPGKHWLLLQQPLHDV
jgi:hypothetical protein